MEGTCPTRAHFSIPTASLRGQSDWPRKAAHRRWAREAGKGSRDSPQLPQTLSPHLHPSPTSASGRRPRPAPPHYQSSAGVTKPQFRRKRASSGHVAVFRRANWVARVTPGGKPRPPRGSEWLSLERAGEQGPANGSPEAGSEMPRSRGRSAGKGLQWLHVHSRWRPRACPSCSLPRRSHIPLLHRPTRLQAGS